MYLKADNEGLDQTADAQFDRAYNVCIFPEDPFPHGIAHMMCVYFRPSYDWMRSISVRNPSMRHNRKVSLVFNHLEPEELADHLTYLEYRAFRRINVS